MLAKRTQKRVDAIEKKVERHNEIVNKSAGIVIVLGSILSFLGASVIKVVAALLAGLT